MSGLVRSRVREILRERGTPLTWFARKVSLSYYHVYSMETGRRRITERYMQRASEVLQLPVDVLFVPADLTPVKPS